MPLKLDIIGGCRVSIRDERVSPKSPLILGAAVFLGLEAGKTLPRTTVSELLWPRSLPTERASRLRWLLSKLRRIGLGIDVTDADIRLPPELVTLDVDRIEAIPASEIGPLLFGYAPTFSPAFSEWLDEQRMHVTAQVCDRLADLLRMAIQSRDWERVIEVGNAILVLSPLNDAATFALADAHYRRGDADRALACLQPHLCDVTDPDRSRAARVVAERLRKGRTLMPSSDTAFVGREIETRRVEDLLRATAQGQGGALIIAGVLGIGKSRVLTHASTRAAMLGLEVIRILFQHDDHPRPLLGLTRLTTDLLAMPGAAGADPQNIERLRLFVGAHWDTSGRGVTREDPAGARHKIRAALLDVFAAVCDEGPLTIVLDDVHSVDEQSLQFFQDLIDGTRTGPVAWLLGWGANDASAPTIRAPVVFLPTLSADECGRLLDDLADRHNVFLNASERSAILGRSAGSPFILGELFKHWLHGGSIADLPASLCSLFESTLQRLSGNARACLQASAVLGIHTTMERIERMLNLRGVDLIAAMAELELAGTLTIGADGRLTGHVLWGEASLASLPPGAKWALHRHAAEQFDLELDRNPSVVWLWESVRHWDAAKYAERARAVALRGAEHLAASGLLSEAADVYERLLTKPMAVPEKLRLLRRRIDLLFRANRATQVIAAVDEHERIAADADPGYDPHNDMELIRRAALMNGIVWPFAEHTVEQISGQAEAAMGAALRCVRDTEASTAHRLAAAKQCVFLSDSSSPVIAEAWRIASGLTPTSHAEARDRLRIALAYELILGDVRRAVGLSEDGRQLEAQLGPSREMVVALVLSAECYRVVGRNADARSACREAIQMATAHGLTESLVFAYDRLLGVSVDIDPPASTRHLLAEMRDALKWVDPDGSSVGSRVTLPSLDAQLLIEEGRASEILSLVPSLEKCLNCPSRRVRARFLAMHMAARLGAPSESRLGELPSALASCFARSDFWLDWPARVYVRFLLRFRGRREAGSFARHYVSEVRRELYPAPHEVLRAAEEYEAALVTSIM